MTSFPIHHFRLRKGLLAVLLGIALIQSVDTAHAAIDPRTANRNDPCYLDPSSCAAGGAGGGGNKPDNSLSLKIKPDRTDLTLLQPLDDSTFTLQAKPGIQIFFDYFNLSWPWILGVCAGLAVLQVMLGGMQMMMSESRDEGKERMKWATAGLLIIVLSGVILTTINPLFYT